MQKKSDGKATIKGKVVHHSKPLTQMEIIPFQFIKENIIYIVSE